jgi:hypothetical protein
MELEDFRELWYERMRLELSTGFRRGRYPARSQEEQTKRDRINKILRQIPQEI